MSAPFDPRASGEPDDAQTIVRERQRGRARVMAWLLGFLVILIFAITMAKIRLGMA